ncbi:hypothetical protein EK904_010925 [Melospiza melodia maxima]|nr:hypothetical protein EK904_010925 [Melospiza melodia maxima]
MFPVRSADETLKQLLALLNPWPQRGMGCSLLEPGLAGQPQEGGLGAQVAVDALSATPTEPESVVKKYLEELKGAPADEDCMICMEKLSCPSGYSDSCPSSSIRPEAVGRLRSCQHSFHLLCVLAMYSNGNKDGSLQCPSCKTIYGEKTGTQPKGKMEISTFPQSLPGHKDCGTIRIVYHISRGIQGPEHPNPGMPYTARGFPRYCYLPDNEKGRKVLELLKVAWKRRLIFTVGTSNTTGESNTVNFKSEPVPGICGVMPGASAALDLEKFSPECKLQHDKFAQTTIALDMLL